MAFLIGKNLAQSSLASGYTAGNTTITVQSGDGSKFDAPSGGNVIVLAIGNPPQFFLEATGVSTDTFTVNTGGFDGSTPVSVTAATPVTQVITAGVLQALLTAVGGMILLEEHTAATSATLDFTTWYSSTYDTYQIELENVLPATNNTICELQVSSDGGSTWASTGFTFGLHLVGTSADSALQGSNAGTAAYISLAQADGSISNGSAGGVSGTVKVYNPGSSAKRIVFLIETGNLHSNGYYYHATGIGEYNGGAAIDALRIKFNSGNIASGTVRVYGLAK